MKKLLLAGLLSVGVMLLMKLKNALVRHVKTI